MFGIAIASIASKFNGRAASLVKGRRPSGGSRRRRGNQVGDFLTRELEKRAMLTVFNLTVTVNTDGPGNGPVGSVRYVVNQATTDLSTAPGGSTATINLEPGLGTILVDTADYGSIPLTGGETIVGPAGLNAPPNGQDPITSTGGVNPVFNVVNTPGEAVVADATFSGESAGIASVSANSSFYLVLDNVTHVNDAVTMPGAGSTLVAYNNTFTGDTGYIASGGDVAEVLADHNLFANNSLYGGGFNITFATNGLGVFDFDSFTNSYANVGELDVFVPAGAQVDAYYDTFENELGDGDEIEANGAGALYVTYVTFSGNESAAEISSFAGVNTVSGCTFSNNINPPGGGQVQFLAYDQTASDTISNSTFVDNAYGDDVFTWVQAGPASSDIFTVTNVTVSGSNTSAVNANGGVVILSNVSVTGQDPTDSSYLSAPAVVADNCVSVTINDNSSFTNDSNESTSVPGVINLSNNTSVNITDISATNNNGGVVVSMPSANESLSISDSTLDYTGAMGALDVIAPSLNGPFVAGITVNLTGDTFDGDVFGNGWTQTFIVSGCTFQAGELKGDTSSGFTVS